MGEGTEEWGWRGARGRGEGRKLGAVWLLPSPLPLGSAHRERVNSKVRGEGPIKLSRRPRPRADKFHTDRMSRACRISSARQTRACRERSSLDMSPNRKICSLEALLDFRRGAAASGKTLVHCHGCFDIVHPGHIHYLQFARS